MPKTVEVVYEDDEFEKLDGLVRRIHFRSVSEWVRVVSLNVADSGSPLGLPGDGVAPATGGRPPEAEAEDSDRKEKAIPPTTERELEEWQESYLENLEAVHADIRRAIFEDEQKLRRAAQQMTKRYRKKQGSDWSPSWEQLLSPDTFWHALLLISYQADPRHPRRPKNARFANRMTYGDFKSQLKQDLPEDAAALLDGEDFVLYTLLNYIKDTWALAMSRLPHERVAMGPHALVVRAMDGWPGKGARRESVYLAALRDDGTKEWDIDEICACLEQRRRRATYAAVAEVLYAGDRRAARAVGGLLGQRPRNHRYSWIVNSTSGKPSGYDTDQMHPELFKESVIETGLEEWLDAHCKGAE